MQQNLFVFIFIDLNDTNSINKTSLEQNVGHLLVFHYNKKLKNI